jgi:hypothetical protein
VVGAAEADAAPASGDECDLSVQCCHGGAP